MDLAPPASSPIGISPVMPFSGDSPTPAELRVVFRPPRGSGVSSRLTASSLDGGTRVAFLLKLVQPGNSLKPYSELRKEVPVVDGVATLTFSNLPTNTVVGTCDIINGTKAGYAQWHGAIDLVGGPNTLEVAPTGSNEPGDQVAQVIDSLLSNQEASCLVQSGLARSVEDALLRSRTLVGTYSVSLLDSARELYLAQVATAPSSQASPFIEAGQQYISSFLTYQGKTLWTRPAENLRSPSGIRTAFNAWSWIVTNRWWEYETWVNDLYRKYIFWFQDPERNRYQYANDSASISALITASLLTTQWNKLTVNMIEVYAYGFADQFGRGAYQVHLTGYASASAGTSTLYRVDSDAWCDVRKPYPESGTITIRRYDDGSVSTLSFNGTCVARYDIRYASGAGETFRTVITGEKGAFIRPVVASAPAAPTDLAVRTENGKHILTWSPVAGAESYNLFLSRQTGVQPSNGVRLGNVASPHTHTPGTAGVPYFYVVTAVNSGGESLPSSEARSLP